MTETITTFAGISRKLSSTIRFFTAFGILVGLLITVSSVFATRLARTREAVYYQVLGARSTFVVKVFGLENLILGGLSGLLAMAISQAASWIIITRVFDITFTIDCRCWFYHDRRHNAAGRPSADYCHHGRHCGKGR